MTNEKTIELGQRVRDTVSGFEGIAVSITEHLHGCRRVSIRPRELDDSGEPVDPHWFDEPRVEVVDEGIVDLVARQNEQIPEPGGPKDTPTRKADSG